MKATRNPIRPAFLIPAITAFISCSAVAAAVAGPNLEILASSSSAAPVKALLAAYQTTHPGDKINVRYFPAARLDSEIPGDVRSDLLILADFDDMQKLAGRGSVDPNTVTIFATDPLVLCAPAYRPLGNLEELKGGKIQRIAIVNPAHGETGMKSVMALHRAGIWEGVQPKLVSGSDAHEVIQYMEKGQAQAGLMLWSDATKTEAVHVVGSFERPYSEPIRYTSAVSTHAGAADAARAFQAFLTSSEAKSVLKAEGYRVE